MPYIDDVTLSAIEKDLDSAHKSFGHGDFSMPSTGALAKTGLRAAEVVAPAFAFSYFNAKSATGEVMLGPVPADLVTGLTLGVLSLFDLAGGYEDDLLNLGLGCLSGYAARTGAAMGAASKLPPAPSTTSTSGAAVPEITGYQYPNAAAVRDNVGSVGGLAAAAAQHAGAMPTMKFVVAKK